MSHKRDEILPLAATQINPLCKMVGQAKKHHTESQKETKEVNGRMAVSRKEEQEEAAEQVPRYRKESQVFCTVE